MSHALAVVAMIAALAQAAPPEPEARLLRFPAIHGDRVVFTYAGNLYTVPASGGVARRLTSHDGFEMFARFSPDGKHLAFTGQYDGNTEVYLMPADGGTPKRLTYTATLGRDDVSDRMGPNNIVLGWRHDGKHVLVRSRMRSFNDFIGQLFLVPVDGGLPEPLPLPRGGFASFSPGDDRLAYNRIFREFRTWKRYRGGMADEVWVHDFATKKTEPITNDPASDIIPMWHGDRIYFLSDRDEARRMNVHVHDTRTRERRQLTQFKDYDVKFPSLGDKAIVFENGGYLYALDLATEQVRKVPVRIHEDMAVGRGGLKDVSKNVTSQDVSPDGKRAVFGARGDVFTVPAQNGPTRNLTGTPGVHERGARWSPDGKLVAYVSDASGEDEIHVRAQDGSEPARALTSGGDTYKYDLAWSPDGKKVLWSDKKNRLQIVDVASRKVGLVDQAKQWEIREFAWSPDSKWVAYTRPEVDSLTKVWLYSLEQDRKFEVTDGWYASSHPVFSGDGKYLYFVSSRDFNPLYGDTEWNHVYKDMEKVYLVTLARDTESPLRPRSDEVGGDKPAGDKPAGDKPAPDKPAPDKPAPDKPAAAKDRVAVKVDPDGLKDRTLGLPVGASNYFGLRSVGPNLYYLRRGTKDGAAQLQLFDLAARKETGLGPADSYEVSADGKKMLVAREGKYALVDLPKGPLAIGEALNLSGLEVKLDRRAEWRQIFGECWRQMRDFFYDPNLHGVDWGAVRKKYEPLVEHVQHRADLTYIIGEMIGELNAGHAYVGGGDVPVSPRVAQGLLGAEVARDAATGAFKVTRVLRGENWDRGLRSPLTEIGVDVKEGEYILAVDGRPVSEVRNLYELLVNTAGKPVTLKVAGKPDGAGSRTVTVTPVADESRLYYHDWVQGNIRKVAEATGGKVGYIHVPDMLASGLNEFVKHYYPQVTRKALIIDVRGNGGGNVSPMLIERLRRQMVMVGIARNGVPEVNPSGTFVGPMACLLNEFSASDGDLFPYRFKFHKMGPLIGKRSWGGVIGIRGSLPLLDGGTLNRPEFSRYDLEGKTWVIEGYGVDPDIAVDNDPAREFAGTDDQLNKAVEVLLKELKGKAPALPQAPPYPKR